MERLLISTESTLSYIYPLDYEYVMCGYVVNKLVMLMLQYEVTGRNGAVTARVTNWGTIFRGGNLKVKAEKYV